MSILELNVNTQKQEAIIDAKASLLDVLREKMFITSPKMGCDTGDCGCCSALVNGQLVRTCLTLAITCQGKEITTVEGLAPSGQLHPVQKAFYEHYGSQCGFCTPGMIVASKVLLDENPNPTRDEVKEGLIGHLCRCTGYIKIIDAVMSAAKEMAADVIVDKE